MALTWGGTKVAAARAIPHDLRRQLYRLMHGEDFRELQRRRHGTSADFASFLEFERTRTLFIHVPKTAGLSIWQAIYGAQITAHVPLDTYKIAFPRSVYRNLFKFAFVRNPLDRCRSAYDFLLQERKNEHFATFVSSYLEEYSDFEHFAEQGLARPEIGRHRLFRTQMYYIASRGSHSPELDFIGRYENLQNDFAALCTILNTEGSQLPHSHIATEPSKDSALSRLARRQVERVYARDYQALGYSPE